DLGVTILLVEQNARAALSVASHGYISEQGKVVLDGSADELRDNEDVKEFYLGGAGDQRKSFKNLKSFKRRKRWLWIMAFSSEVETGTREENASRQNSANHLFCFR